MKIFQWVLMCALTLGVSFTTPAQDLKSALKKIEGTYVGEWTAYKPDAQGLTVPTVTWKDTVVSRQVVQTKTEAAVVLDEAMRFDNPRIPAMRFSLKEGYLLDDKGAPTTYFIEVQGKRMLVQSLGSDTFVYNTQPEAQELARMGFTNVRNSLHTMVKVVTTVGGLETHKITRLTTVVLADGKHYQFVSLAGTHQKIKPTGK
jgi:hypothetical protein